MGNRTSKNSIKTLARTYATELRTYATACKEDTEIQSFDTRVLARTGHVINTLAKGVKDRALSFDSLKVAMESLLEMNQEVVKVILDCKEDIWENKEMFEIVEDFFDTSLKTQDFCNALERGLQRILTSHLLIRGVLPQLEEESQLVQGGNGYKKTLEKLMKFKDAVSPLGEDFVNLFQSVYKQQMLMLKKLQLRKYKHIHTLRKLSSIIFVATYATVLICSVVVAAMSAPPVVAALSTTSVTLGIMGKWIDSLWKNYEKALKAHKDVISSMQAGTYAVKDLYDIRFLIQELDTEIRSINKNDDYVVEHAAVKMGINAINRILEVSKKNIEKLGILVDLCSRDITRARTVILQRIINHPNNGSSST
ncbi:hypothetical protein CARUB_v10005102mg [Capsella rubella]|uniref:Uncharacterized protein n=1 Tax=Capsella rubella TaxID=81985 RepID=R0F530_9BRAS|nr:UPF0496 protein At4g34320 [Capsella rubella]EOA16877.1 hypothetical protein CARUB_v10005102mg [Capsella rubella]